MISVVPVSYTHLDVYKRQVSETQAADQKARDDGNSHPEAHLHGIGQKGAEHAGNGFRVQDVYKRQRQGSLHTLSLCGDKVYFTGMREMGLTECYCFDGKEEEKLTSFNDEIMAERSVLPVEEFTFTYKGLELDGYVIKPLDYDPNKTYPGILTIHGGPRATFAPTFFHENQVFANAGYFVFYTNPLGSDGRGNDFADLSGRHGSIDFEHCMAVTDEVLKRYPQIDEKRLGVMGGSYGGFMTNWVIGNTTRSVSYTHLDVYKRQVPHRWYRHSWLRSVSP